MNPLVYKGLRYLNNKNKLLFFLLDPGGNSDGYFTINQIGAILTTTEWPVGDAKTAEVVLTVRASDGALFNSVEVTITYNTGSRTATVALITMLVVYCICKLLSNL